ncbi:FAD-binding oxidoreductase [Paenibacillus sp. N4]|uniref:NAD(P)/FAD-dependent oxidoreductase n=1 Tax=Paenibacillus vietnamensis TaxID=2590547 RepID=UPI001CD14B3F|nr:FAD-dependent oxidoreductase [Paenibacillus vietnamensis]MCA0756672.1 FAD-binding oxidoreductase [Paenibacillus vietnamensis]
MKELYTGKLYWPETSRKTREYEPLRENKKTQVAIIGGGMTGTICSSILVKNGLSVVMLERDRVAGGSTSANTGLLQAGNDIMLCDLIKRIGERDAAAFYRACREAIDMIAAEANALSVDVGFERRSSLYFASTEQHLPKLRQEYDALKACGFDVEFWLPGDIAEHFPFRKPGAIVSHGDAEINPYRYVSALAEDAVTAGLQIHERTDVVPLHKATDGKYHLRTTDGFEIEAEHVVYAVGYEPEELRGQLIKAELNRSFAVVTGVQPNLQSWHERFLIWETARPYLYLRTTPDNRAIIGGLDEDSGQPLHSDAGRRKRSLRLLEKLGSLFPGLQAPAEYEWSATFGESRDGLPFIGEDPKWPKVYYCLGYGGNGTAYSMLAAHVLRDLIRGEQHPLSRIVKLDRPSLTSI